MDIEAIKRRARQLDVRTQEEISKAYFQDVVAWFVYLGLLRHNVIAPRRAQVSLADVLRAGDIEPRILELLPALLINLPETIKFQAGDVPPDLADVLTAIKRHTASAAFRGVPPSKYLHWLTSPAFELAARRLRFRSLPRARGEKLSAIAEAVSSGRLERSLTQKQLAVSYGLSLRVIRDLEQGKLTGSLRNVMDILQALDRKITVS